MEIFKIDNIISFVGKTLLLTIDNKKIIVFGDVHIGLEEALNKEGFLVPRTHFKDMYEEIRAVLKLTKPDKIVINGDFKHEFGRISKQEWNDTFKFMELLMRDSAEIVLIQGKRDKILQPLAEKYNIVIKEFYKENSIYITHGDKVPENKTFDESKTVVIGHEHPCVVVRDNHKFEKFKTFLIGEYEKKKLVVLPSFNPIEGVDVTKERLLSPFLKKRDISNFDVYVTADEIYHFGKLANFMKKE